MNKIKYFIPFLGAYYCLKNMGYKDNHINELDTPILYYGTSIYHGLTVSLIILLLLT